MSLWSFSENPRTKDAYIWKTSLIIKLLAFFFFLFFFLSMCTCIYIFLALFFFLNESGPETLQSFGLVGLALVGKSGQVGKLFGQLGSCLASWQVVGQLAG